MKSKNIIIVLLSLVWGTYARGESMFDGNPSWLYLIFIDSDVGGGYRDALYTLYVVNTEEIDGIKYYKVVYDVVAHYGAPGRKEKVRSEEVFINKIWEENNRILVDYEEYKSIFKDYDYIPYKKTDEGNMILYDFNMKVGDRYEHVEGHDDVWVTDIHKIKTDDGTIRKFFTLSNGQKIVEGIGCLSAVTYPLLYYLCQWDAEEFQKIHHCLISVRKNEMGIFSQTDEEALSGTSLDKYLVYHDFWNKGLYYSISFTSDSEVKVACYSNPNPTGTYWGTVAIPESVEHEGDTYRVTGIDDYAFGNSPLLYSITLPGSVSSIGQEAFSGCTGLTEITCKAAVPPICEADCFLGVGQRDCKLYVPEVSVEVYRNAPVWQDFDIIATDFSGIEEIRVDEELDEPQSPLYDLQGRRVTGTPERGLYIRNGKKVWIK